MPAVLPRDKYYLRSLHEEIGLFDRKLAHMLKYDTFATDKERDAAAGKLSSKRELLVRAARQLADEGVDFKIAELPRSLRPDVSDEETVPNETISAAVPEAVEASSATSASAPDDSVLNFRNEIQEYMKKRRKEFVPAA